METDSGWVVVGIDNGGTSNNATILDPSGGSWSTGWSRRPAWSPRAPRWPSTPWPGAGQRARPDRHAAGRGPRGRAGHARAGLGRRGHLLQGGDQLRPAGLARLRRPGALEARWGCRWSTTTTPTRPPSTPTVSASGPRAAGHSSVSVIVGTGLGGGVIESGRIVKGAAGMAGRVGHVQIPHARPAGRGPAAAGVQLRLRRRRRERASLTGIERNLLPYWLTRFPRPRAGRVADPKEAAKLVRATASGRTRWPGGSSSSRRWPSAGCSPSPPTTATPTPTSWAAAWSRPAPKFRQWFLATVREHTALREEQARVATLALVPDLDMAGARGAALAAHGRASGRRSGSGPPCRGAGSPRPSPRTRTAPRPTAGRPAGRSRRPAA
jgi:hypothetical protein